MWLKCRIKRLKSRWSHIRRYFQTLSNANEINRLTDLSHSKNLVLLLYGFGATRRSVSILESRLRQDGFDVISIKLGGFLDLFNTAPIDKTARNVAQKIEGLCGRFHLPRFTIIGYSKGGLIGRYYVTHLGGDKRVHTLITLATPHRGNPWSLLGGVFLLGLLWKGLRQMIPSSKFMRTLAKKQLPSSVYTVSIFSRQDKTCPPKYSFLSERGEGVPVINVELPGLRHSDFVIKQQAYRIIHDHLLTGLTHALKGAS